MTQLPTTEAISDKWIMLHVDCDCFYAACERLKHPELNNEPLVIGMGYDDEEAHGAVATASYEAREYGVESAMPISEALTKLPRKTCADPNNDDTPTPSETGYYKPVDLEYYTQIGEEIQEILAEHSDTLEPVSIDEAYLDVTDQTTWDTVEQYANMIKETIHEEVGIPVSIGVAPTKSAAKVASDHDKPNGLVIVRPGTVREFFAPLPIESVHGIGPVTANTLRNMGIETGGELATADPEKLKNELGSRGVEVRQRARGQDTRPVKVPDNPKSFSNESSFNDSVTSMTVKQEKLSELVTQVTTRARDQNALYQTIGIKVIQPPFNVNTRAHTLPGPIDNPELVESTALELLREFSDSKIRKLGVRLSNLSFASNTQPTLSEWETETEGEDSLRSHVSHKSRTKNTGGDAQSSLSKFRN